MTLMHFNKYEFRPNSNSKSGTKSKFNYYFFFLTEKGEGKKTQKSKIKANYNRQTLDPSLSCGARQKIGSNKMKIGSSQLHKVAHLTRL